MYLEFISFFLNINLMKILYLEIIQQIIVLITIINIS